MHGTTGRTRGRPKAIPRAIAYHDMTRREREHHRRHLAEISPADPQWDIRIASLALEPYGMKLIPNGQVVHVYRDYRHRRQISGSVWDGRKLIWRAPTVRDYPHKLGKLRTGPKIRCARRPWSVPGQPVDPKRDYSYPPRGTDDAAAAALLAVIGHLAAPETKRAQTYLHEGVNDEILKMRDGAPEQSTPWRPAYQVSNRPYWYGDLIPRLSWVGWARNWAVRVLVGRPWLHSCPHWEVTTIETMIPRPSGKFSGFGGPLSMHPTWPWIENLGAELGHGDVWQAMIDTDILRTGTKALKKPDISRDEPFKAAARLWNWQINNRHRKQMRAKFPRK